MMMNQKTRRLSKMPEEVRDEISYLFIDRHALQEDVSKIIKLDENAKYVNSDLKVRFQFDSFYSSILKRREIQELIEERIPHLKSSHSVSIMHN